MQRKMWGWAAAWLIAAGSCGAALADGDAVATVNGRPIERADLLALLIDAHGLEMLQQLVLLEAARAETKRRGMRVTAGDVDAEFQLALRDIAQQSGLDEESATDETKRQALDVVLRNKGVTMAEFKVGMERNAHLRKLAEDRVKINEATLREEFARTYGEKVRVRRISAPETDAATINAALSRLAAGEDFETVARALSADRESAGRGGEMEPFTFEDETIPAEFREAAFALRADGELSPMVKVGRVLHILRREARIPAESVRFEEARDLVERNLRDRIMREQMNQVSVELFNAADVRVIDRALKARYEEFRRGAASAP